MLLSIQSSFNVYDIYHHGMCMHCAAQVVTLHHNHHEVLVVSLMSGYRSSCNRSTIGSFLLHNGEFAGCGSFTICSNPVHTVIVIYLPLHVHLGKRCVFSLLITGSFFETQSLSMKSPKATLVLFPRFRTQSGPSPRLMTPVSS